MRRIGLPAFGLGGVRYDHPQPHGGPRGASRDDQAGATLNKLLMALGLGRKSLAGSMIGGIAETQEVIDSWAARNIKAEIALIRPEDINQAYEQVVNKDVRYRFVIDMASMQSVAGAKS